MQTIRKKLLASQLTQLQSVLLGDRHDYITEGATVSNVHEISAALATTADCGHKMAVT